MTWTIISDGTCRSVWAVIALGGLLAAGGCVEERVPVRAGLSRPGTVGMIAEPAASPPIAGLGANVDGAPIGGGDEFGGFRTGASVADLPGISGSQARFSVTPLGTVDYDGATLPQVSPDGRFMALQVGQFEGWTSAVLGEDAGDGSSAGRVAPLARPEPMLPQVERSVIVYDISGPKAILLPWCISGEVAARHGNLTLGRQADLTGVLVEQSSEVIARGTGPGRQAAARAYTVRRIGKLDYLSGEVAWLTGFGSASGGGLGMAMHGVVLGDGQLVYTVRDRLGLTRAQATDQPETDETDEFELPPSGPADQPEVALQPSGRLGRARLVVIDQRGERALYPSNASSGAGADHVYACVLADGRSALIISITKFGLTCRVVSMADGSDLVAERLLVATRPNSTPNAADQSQLASLCRAGYLAASSVPAWLGQHLRSATDQEAASRLALLVEPQAGKLLAVDIAGSASELMAGDGATGPRPNDATTSVLAESTAGVQLIRMNAALGIVRSSAEGVSLAPLIRSSVPGSTPGRWRLGGEISLYKGAALAMAYSRSGTAGCVVVTPPRSGGNGAVPRYEVVRVELMSDSR